VSGTGTAEDAGTDAERVSFIWLEITGKCQLACVHCYADSGPHGDHGSMSHEDWFSVIRQARDIGVETVAFIGGEPTLHPGLRDFIEYALELGLLVRVISNLVHVPEDMWDVLKRPSVAVWASYYSDDPNVHDAVTLRRGSHRRTTANLERAARLGVRVGGLITTADARVDPEPTRDALSGMGVLRSRVASIQAVGRAAYGSAPTMSDLCGQCSGRLLAVDPRGAVFPCIMGRWLTVGNVREEPLATLVKDRRLHDVREQIRAAFDPRVTGRPPVLIRHKCDSNGGSDGGSCAP
jgi:MoaA/NifB/PqqE/SkfB family radical SAM enzyme